MKHLFFITSVIVLTALFSGCKAKQSAFASYSALNGEWGVVELDGQKVNPEETRQFLSLDMSGLIISGHTGCNRMSGKIELNSSDKNQIRFDKIASTRMGCMDMNPEKNLLKALNNISRFELVKEGQSVHEVFFYDADNQKMLTLRKN